jgi:probable HAF family extracellular repeat protein
MLDLGTLGGDSMACGVDASGRVVGWSYILLPGNIIAQHAFSWTAAGGLVDLGTLGGNSSVANAINERRKEKTQTCRVRPAHL